MIVEQIWAANACRNFNYLVACPHNPTGIARLREAFPDLPDNPDAMTVFLKLRALRNGW